MMTTECAYDVGDIGARIGALAWIRSDCGGMILSLNEKRFWRLGTAWRQP